MTIKSHLITPNLNTSYFQRSSHTKKLYLIVWPCMIADWHTKEGYLIFFFTFFTTKILTIIFVDFYKKISLVQSKIWEPPIFCTQRTSENIHPKYFFVASHQKKIWCYCMTLYDWYAKEGSSIFFSFFHYFHSGSLMDGVRPGAISSVAQCGGSFSGVFWKASLICIFGLSQRPF